PYVPYLRPSGARIRRNALGLIRACFLFTRSALAGEERKTARPIAETSNPPQRGVILTVGMAALPAVEDVARDVGAFGRQRPPGWIKNWCRGASPAIKQNVPGWREADDSRSLSRLRAIAGAY